MVRCAGLLHGCQFRSRSASAGLHSPASPHRVLDARRRRAGRGGGGRGRRRRPDGGGDHRPRGALRGRGLLQGGGGRRGQADHRHGGLSDPGLAVRPPPTPRGPALPHHPAGHRRHRLPQPGEAGQPGLPGGLLLQAPHGRGVARRVLRRASSGPPAASGAMSPNCSPRMPTTEEGNVGVARDFEAAVAAAAMYQDLFGKDNFFVEVMDHGVTAQQRVLPDLLRHLPPHRGPAPGHQRLPLHPPGAGRGARCAALHPDRGPDVRPGALQVPGRAATG